MLCTDFCDINMHVWFRAHHYFLKADHKESHLPPSVCLAAGRKKLSVHKTPLNPEILSHILEENMPHKEATKNLNRQVLLGSLPSLLAITIMQRSLRKNPKGQGLESFRRAKTSKVPGGCHQQRVWNSMPLSPIICPMQLFICICPD